MQLSENQPTEAHDTVQTLFEQPGLTACRTDTGARNKLLGEWRKRLQM